ncbi:Tat pathway signal sequence domain protein OS=Streptomyces microflavus OX=1919 GN=Smic_36470 PE=4 SV=1 [Streptomyces microflavus]
MLDLKTKSRRCFGSAGCNVTKVEPTLSYLGLLPLDPDETYSITYEVRGGEDGAVIQTMELTNQTSLSYQPVAMSTAKSSSKLTAEVTDIAMSG